MAKKRYSEEQKRELESNMKLDYFKRTTEIRSIDGEMVAEGTGTWGGCEVINLGIMGWKVIKLETWYDEFQSMWRWSAKIEKAEPIGKKQFICRDCEKPTVEHQDNLCEPCYKWHVG